MNSMIRRYESPFSLYTKGPWMRVIGRFGWGTSCSQDEQFVATETGAGVLLVQHDGSLEGTANAELAVRAPELLAGLLHMLDHGSDPYDDDQERKLAALRALVEPFR